MPSQLDLATTKYGIRVKKRDSWGPAVAALTLGVFAVIIVLALYFGVRGLF